jgi:hypothetical protein
VEGAADRDGKRLCGQRSSNARHTFQQAMPAGEQSGHQPLDEPVPSDDDLLDLEQRQVQQSHVSVGWDVVHR